MLFVRVLSYSKNIEAASFGETEKERLLWAARRTPPPNEIVAIEALELVGPPELIPQTTAELDDLDALLTAAGDHAATLEGEAELLEQDAIDQALVAAEAVEAAAEDEAIEAVAEDDAEEEAVAHVDGDMRELLKAVTTEARRLW